MPLRRRLVIVAILGAPVLLGLSSVSASLYHFYDGVADPPPNYPTGGVGVDIFDNQWGAQSFRASQPYVLTRVALWALNKGAPGNSSTLEIRQDSAGSPNMAGPPMASATAFAPGSYGWVNFTPALQVQLTQGTIYWVLLKNIAPTGGTGWSWWNTKNYTFINPGVGESSSNHGASWAKAPGDFELRTFGYLETNLLLSMAVDRATVQAGDVLTYTIWFNNTGTEVAARVWVNDSIPGGLRYVSDNASSIGGVKTGNYNWTFTNVGQGSHYFLVRVSVNAGLASGTLLSSRAYLNYTDFAGLPRPGSTAVTTVTVSGGPASPATIVLTLTVDKVKAQGGDVLTYALWFNNTGNEFAAKVWVNDSISEGATYLADNASDIGGSRSGNYNWSFSRVMAGVHYFLIRVSVDGGVIPGIIVTNRASLNYTDATGASRPGSRAAVSTVVSSTGTLPPWVPVAVGLVLAIPVVLLALRPKGKVEEGFLVNYAGQLMAHFSHARKPELDKDTVAAMLTAVQDFVRDTFSAAKEGELRHIDFGQRRLLIRRGSYSYLAVVVRGRTPEGLPRRMEETLERIEERYKDVMARWRGDVAEMAGASVMLAAGVLVGRGRRALRRLARSWVRGLGRLKRRSRG